MRTDETREIRPHDPVLRIGPIWRDANVRVGPSLQAPIVELLLPADGVDHAAGGWVRGDEVVEGVIVSDVWFELSPGRWCSAVNFDQDTVAGAVSRTAGDAGPVDRAVQ